MTDRQFTTTLEERDFYKEQYERTVRERDEARHELGNWILNHCTGDGIRRAKERLPWLKVREALEVDPVETVRKAFQWAEDSRRDADTN